MPKFHAGSLYSIGIRVLENLGVIFLYFLQLAQSCPPHQHRRLHRSGIVHLVPIVSQAQPGTRRTDHLYGRLPRVDSCGEALFWRLGVSGAGGAAAAAAHPLLRGGRRVHAVAVSAGRVPQQHRLG